MNKTRAGKRGAISDLNHDNWDAEEEEEDRGSFQTASADTISKRKIKIAKRRSVYSSEETPGTGGLFKSFTAFASSTDPTSSATTVSTSKSDSITTVPTFSFGNSRPADGAKPFSFSAAAGGKVDGTADDKKSAAVPSTMKFGVTPFGFTPKNTTFTFGNSASQSAPSAKVEEKKEKEKDEEEKMPVRDRHLHSLRDLNLSVTKWISSHVDKNPYCDLTPVFEDYGKHLKEIEKKYPYEEESKEVEETVPTSKPIIFGRSNGDGGSSLSKPPVVPANFGISAAAMDAVREEDEEEENDEEEEKKDQETEDKNETKAPSLSAPESADKTKENEKEEKKEDEKKPQAPSLFTGINFNFPSSGTTPLNKPAFPFTGLSSWSGSSSLTSSSLTTATASKPEDEEEDYVPPKAEVREIKEEGSVLTRRCKLYYKWEDAWHDKGVGNLHLKPMEENKLQLLIRADTNLGNILLNVMVTAAVPITRNKANLTLICVPSPPMRQKKSDDKSLEPMPLLVRLKTEADAEAVLTEMDRLRKKE